MNEIDLLQKQVDMMRMAEKYGVKDWRELVRVRVSTLTEKRDTLFNAHYMFAKEADPKFALAVVDGKPVFEGDALYDKQGHKCYAHHVDKSCYGKLSIWSEDSCFAHIDECSWNPPKPKTVMVELRREVAEWLWQRDCDQNSISSEVSDACRKALENQ